MKAKTAKTAPRGEGWMPCLRCHRYRHPDDIERGYCKERDGCAPPDQPTAGQLAALALSKGLR